jgi:two-component system phosphate regulon sensor histidine kinase PhoR
LDFEADKNLRKVYSDPFQVLQVVENLLYNAIRYTNFPAAGENKNRESGKVTVKLYKKNNSVICDVVDNGIGIPEHDQKFIFQKFFRADNVRRYQASGSGLGLYICKNIIERSKGKMGFSSKENIGTTFWFTLPTGPK